MSAALNQVDLTGNPVNDDSQLTEETGEEEEVVEVPPPPASRLHPFLADTVTMDNYDNGIFTIGNQKWNVDTKKKFATVKHIHQNLLQKFLSKHGMKNAQGKACKTQTACMWALANPTAHHDNGTTGAVASVQVNYLQLGKVAVDPEVSKLIMMQYGKGLSKDEQTDKKKTDQDLFTMMLKEYNSSNKCNKLLVKGLGIPKSYWPNQYEAFPVDGWAEFCRFTNTVIRDVEEEHCRIENLSRQNGSDTDHLIDEEETKNKSDGLTVNKKKKTNNKSKYQLRIIRISSKRSLPPRPPWPPLPSPPPSFCKLAMDAAAA